MTIRTEIIGYDANSKQLPAPVAEINGIRGLSVYTSQLSQRTTLFQPALNDAFGNEMAIDVTFSGTPDGIYDGGDTTLWTPSAISGTWDFVSTTNPHSPSAQCVDATGTVNGSTALFTRSSSIDLSSYTAITGFIRLETWGSGTKHVTIQGRLSGLDVGIPVNLDDFISTSTLNEYQNYTIPLADMGLEVETIDEITMTTVKISGATPGYRIDDWQIEETGAPVEFKIEAPPGTIYHIDRIFLNYADVLDVTLLNNCTFNLDHTKILGLDGLTNGIVFQRVRQNEIIFGANIRTVGDSIKGGAEIHGLTSAANNNTCLTLRVDFLAPVVLNSSLEDKIAVIINDDLTDLVSFTALATGSTEPILQSS